MTRATSSPDVEALLARPAGKRAVVVGGGKTGAYAARLLARLGADVVVTDDAPLEKVRDGLAKHGCATVDAASPFARAGVPRIHAGGIARGVVDEADLVVLSPGVPRAHPAIAPALDAGKPVVNEVELAHVQLAARGRVRTVGITGTNGKSTTTTMCGAIARAYDDNAFVGGNLGTPYCACALAVLDGAALPHVAVLELSSYQLETIRHLALAAAVVTNLSPDHLDRYPSAEAYYAAKARIFDLVVDGGGISLNAADPESRRHLAPPPAHGGARARCDFDVSAGQEGIAVVDAHAAAGPRLLAHLPSHGVVDVVLELANPHIVGHHNMQNAAAAVAGALLAGVPQDAWQRGLDAYAGIAHRLERIGEKNGVAWFNDSKGTNVDATVTAVKSFAGGVHLIAGGLGKGAPYAPLVDVGRNRLVAVYTIGQDAPAIEAAFAGVVDVVPCGTLDAACDKAAARARPGEVVLLSPACASFDQFRDYAHRGETFRALFAAAPEETR